MSSHPVFTKCPCPSAWNPYLALSLFWATFQPVVHPHTLWLCEAMQVDVGVYAGSRSSPSFGVLILLPLIQSSFRLGIHSSVC